jgi:hypothetical protein
MPWPNTRSSDENRLDLLDTRYRVGHPDHLKVFASPEIADKWFRANDPEGVAYAYEIIE